jgi:uncharacterized membrane protein
MAKTETPGENEGADGGGETPQLIRPVKSAFLARLRTYFLTGILITAPIGITAYLSIEFINFVDSSVTPLIPARYNPETYLPFGLPGLGLLVMAVFLTMVGFLTANFLGRQLVRAGERLVDRMPVVRGIYGALKQIFETVLAKSSTSFRQCVLVEWPRKGAWTVAFVTGQAQGEILRRAEQDLVAIYVPTTPNPTSGYLMYLPRTDVIFLDMSVEDGLKLVISGGLVIPPDGASAKSVGAPSASKKPKLEEKKSA